MLCRYSRFSEVHKLAKESMCGKWPFLGFVANYFHLGSPSSVVVSMSSILTGGGGLIGTVDD